MMRDSIRQKFDFLLGRLGELQGNFADMLAMIWGLPEGNFFVSGGAVRDLMRGEGNKVKDIDIFLSACGFETIREYMITNGTLTINQFGTNRWYPQSNGDCYYDIIQVERFNNGLWPCTTITDVLNQFDFTANAIAFDLKTGEFFDPQNGLRDIEQKILRAVRFDFPELNVSDEIPISRNTVLWFRYNYYAAKLHFKIEQLTAGWIADNKFREEQLAVFETYFFKPFVSA